MRFSVARLLVRIRRILECAYLAWSLWQIRPPRTLQQPEENVAFAESGMEQKAATRIKLMRVSAKVPETEEKWKQRRDAARRAGAKSIVEHLEWMADDHADWACVRLADIEREKVSWWRPEPVCAVSCGWTFLQASSAQNLKPGVRFSESVTLAWKQKNPFVYFSGVLPVE